MVDEGAAIVDVGGESTRPGAKAASEQQELDRVIPVIEAIRNACDVLISVDTGKPAVMREAVRAGAGMINDVYALQHEGAVAAAAELAVPVCLMHMQGQPRTMQDEPFYDDVVVEVMAFLADRAAHCESAGVRRENLVIDPGFGFGKTRRHNIELLANLRQFESLGLPVLAGLSRKSTLGQITGKGVEERLPGSLAAAVIAVIHGARIIRVHDVGETVDALKVTKTVMEAQK